MGGVETRSAPLLVLSGRRLPYEPSRQTHPSGQTGMAQCAIPVVTSTSETSACKDIGSPSEAPSAETTNPRHGGGENRVTPAATHGALLGLPCFPQAAPKLRYRR